MTEGGRLGTKKIEHITYISADRVYGESNRRSELRTNEFGMWALDPE